MPLPSRFLALTLALSAPAAPSLAQPTPAEPPKPVIAPNPPPEVKVGSPAPKLQIEKWLKGSPVESLDKGIFVVEMWATWCAPCIQNIPRLTALQKQYKDQVRVIGVNIWEDSHPVKEGTYLDRVTTFVSNMSDQMDYTVAFSGAPSPMSTTWMMASAQAGIPCAFLIKDGKVQWIGHPVALERALTKVLEGTLNVKDPGDPQAKELTKAQERERRIRNTVGRLTTAHQAGDTATVNKLIDELIELAPEEFSYDFQTRAQDMLEKEGEAAWYAYVRKMTSGPLKQEPRSLNFVAAVILSRELIKDRDTDLALDLATRAVQITQEKNAAYLSTLASAHWAKDDAASAISTQEKALAALKPTEEDGRPEYQKTLDTYKAGKP